MALYSPSRTASRNSAFDTSLAYLNTYRAVIHIHAYWRDDLVAPVDLGAWREISSAAIAHGRRHYSGSGEPLATTLAVLECLQREGFVTVEERNLEQ